MKQTTQTSKQLSSVSFRAIAIGLILIPINCYWIVQIEVVQYSAQPTIVSLIFTVVFSVFVLTLLNLLLKRLSPKLALHQGELVVIYVMLSVTSATAGHSTLEILIPILGHAFWFATPENDWNNLFWRYIPKWLSVDDKKVLSGYYEGDSTLYTTDHFLGWLTPLWKTSSSTTGGVYPYVNYQGFGAYIGIFLIAFFMSRKYFWGIFKSLSGRGDDIDDSDEPMPYRVAVLTLVFSVYTFALFG